MRFQFTKMHALGNDYILIDGIEYPEVIELAPRIAPAMSDRHFGIGGDGLIFAARSDKADLAMRMFNADGTESEMCGNGIRQLSRFAFEKGIVKKTEMTIETLAGNKRVWLVQDDASNWRIEVDMGEPVLIPSLIPVAGATVSNGLAKRNLKVADRDFEFTCVSMGNPHAITFLKGVKEFDVAKYGQPVEMMTDVFPRRTNVEFIEVLSRSELRMRVWERGSGETLACGTGACASAVAASLNGFADRKVNIHLLGGDLQVEWRQDNRVIMTGGAKKVFEGETWTEGFGI